MFRFSKSSLAAALVLIGLWFLPMGASAMPMIDISPATAAHSEAASGVTEARWFHRSYGWHRHYGWRHHYRHRFHGWHRHYGWARHHGWHRGYGWHHHYGWRRHYGWHHRYGWHRPYYGRPVVYVY